MLALDVMRSHFLTLRIVLVYPKRSDVANDYDMVCDCAYVVLMVTSSAKQLTRLETKLLRCMECLLTPTSSSGSEPLPKFLFSQSSSKRSKSSSQSSLYVFNVRLPIPVRTSNYSIASLVYLLRILITRILVSLPTTT
jgi:hypothetical protein